MCFKSIYPSLYKHDIMCPVAYIRTDRAVLQVLNVTRNLCACMTWHTLPSMRHAGHHNSLELLIVTNLGFYTDLKSLKLYMLQLHSFTQLSKNLNTCRNQAICGFSQEEYLRTHVWHNGLTKYIQATESFLKSYCAEIPGFSLNLAVHSRAQNSPPLVPIHSYINTLYSVTPQSLRSTSILSLCLRFSHYAQILTRNKAFIPVLSS